MRPTGGPVPGRGLARLALAMLLLFAAPLVLAAIDPLPFESPEQEQRFRELAAELRCVMCQNQSLADSNAGIAQDLRREIFTLMQAGKSDDEIKQFLSERYTDFVLYRPPLRRNTLALWFGPLLVLLGGAVAVAVMMRRRARQYHAQSRNERDAPPEEW